MIHVLPITNPADLDEAFAIRRLVFVEEQKVSREEEYDEYEISSTHFLARADGTPCGTARWRRTSNGIKLERFAVLATHRGLGVGKALVRAVLDDVLSQQPQRPVSHRRTDQSGTADPTEQIYLHAQLTAMPLYAGFGFVPIGLQFEEAGIQHYKMVLPAESTPGQDGPGSGFNTVNERSLTDRGSTTPPQ